MVDYWPFAQVERPSNQSHPAGSITGTFLTPSHEERESGIKISIDKDQRRPAFNDQAFFVLPDGMDDILISTGSCVHGVIHFLSDGRKWWPTPTCTIATQLVCTVVTLHFWKLVDVKHASNSIPFLSQFRDSKKQNAKKLFPAQPPRVTNIIFCKRLFFQFL